MGDALDATLEATTPAQDIVLGFEANPQALAKPTDEQLGNPSSAQDRAAEKRRQEHELENRLLDKHAGGTIMARHGTGTTPFSHRLFHQVRTAHADKCTHTPLQGESAREQKRDGTARARSKAKERACVCAKTRAKAEARDEGTCTHTHTHTHAHTHTHIHTLRHTHSLTDSRFHSLTHLLTHTLTKLLDPTISRPR